MTEVSERPVLRRWVFAMLLLLGIGLPPSAGAQVTNWRPPATTCGAVAYLCIRLDEVWVLTAPNDFGSTEEWHLSFAAGDRHVDIELEVTDNFQATSGDTVERHVVGRRLCLPKDTAPFGVSVRGFEDDSSWFDPTRRDTVPEVSFSVSSACSPASAPPPDSVEEEVRACALDTSQERNACYLFSADWRQRTEPRWPTCTGQQKCCGVMDADGRCVGNCWPRANPCP